MCSSARPRAARLIFNFISLSLSLSSTRERRLCSSLSYAARARDRAGRTLTFLNKQVFFISRELCSSLCELYAARGGPASFFDFSRTGRALQSELCAPPPSSRARAYLYIISSSAVCELCAAPSSRRGVLNDIYFMSRALCSLSYMYAARALISRGPSAAV
jgi:hypothetical protein